METSDREENHQTQLKDATGVSTNAIANMSKGEKVSMETLDKICNMLDCDIGDIMSFKKP